MQLVSTQQSIDNAAKLMAIVHELLARCPHTQTCQWRLIQQLIESIRHMVDDLFLQQLEEVLAICWVDVVLLTVQHDDAVDACQDLK